jgi:hypothetical protein
VPIGALLGGHALAALAGRARAASATVVSDALAHAAATPSASSSTGSHAAPRWLLALRARCSGLAFEIVRSSEPQALQARRSTRG